MKNKIEVPERAPQRHTWAGYGLLAALLALLLVVSACAPRVSTMPEERAVRTVDVGQNGQLSPGEGSVITHGLEEESSPGAGPDPWKLAKEAEGAPPGKREELLLEASAGFIEMGRYATARTLLDRLNPALLPLPRQRRHTLLRAALEQGLGRPAKALELLAPLLADSTLPDDARAQGLLLQALSLEALGRVPQAVQALLDRDLLLRGAAQLENQRRLLALLGGLDTGRLQDLQAASADTHLTGWIALALVLTRNSPAERREQLARWRELYPHHPASPRLLSQLEGGTGQGGSYGTVALLLPLTSPVGAAAQTFYDGFMAAQATSTAPQRPTITLQDTGADNTLSAFYYQAARNEKADFVVGPLGRKAVAQLLAQTTPDLPTLLLGPLPPGKSLPDVYSFSLSPEQDARLAAGHAFGRGLRKAAVIGADSAWGRRVGEAFSAEWRALGGSIVASSYFPPNQADLSGTVRQVMAIDPGYNSEGQGGKTQPRRRRDVDMLFLAVKPAQGRLLVPQLKFFDAYNLPLYATSYIFGARIDTFADADLEGVIFSDMPWVAGGATASPPSPYRGSPMDRLYALGLESYALIQRLASLQANPWQLYRGVAMTLSVAADGTVVRHPVWYQFRGGRPVPLGR